MADVVVMCRFSYLALLCSLHPFLHILSLKGCLLLYSVANHHINKLPGRSYHPCLFHLSFVALILLLFHCCSILVNHSIGVFVNSNNFSGVCDRFPIIYFLSYFSLFKYILYISAINQFITSFPSTGQLVFTLWSCDSFFHLSFQGVTS